MTKIIQEGIVYVLSMLNPAGAIVQAVRAIYSGIMFFMDNAERIKDLVSAITNSIADIAAGKIGTAAKYITDSLIRTIPIVLSFLSHLLKLNKITEVLRKAVDKVRKPIEKAIKKGVKWLVKKVKGWLKKAKNFFSGKKDKKGSKKVAETSGEDKARVEGEENTKEEIWWKEYDVYKDKSGEKHTLYFKGTGDNAQLMRASTPMILGKYITQLKGDIDGIKDKDKRSKYLKIFLNIEEIQKEINDYRYRENSKGKTVASDLSITSSEKINEFLDELGDELAKLPSEIKDVSLWKRPESEINYSVPKTKEIKDGDKQTSQDGVEIVADILTINNGKETGSAASYYSKLYDAAKADNLQVYAGHLLNSHLHGTGNKAKNIAPISGTLNSFMSNTFEQKVKEAIYDENRVFYYRVKVLWNREETLFDNGKVNISSLLPSGLDVEIYEKKIQESDKLTEKDYANKANWTEKGEVVYKNEKDMALPKIKNQSNEKTTDEMKEEIVKLIPLFIINNPDLGFDKFRKESSIRIEMDKIEKKTYTEIQNTFNHIKKERYTNPTVFEKELANVDNLEVKVKSELEQGKDKDTLIKELNESRKEKENGPFTRMKGNISKAKIAGHLIESEQEILKIARAKLQTKIEREYFTQKKEVQNHTFKMSGKLETKFGELETNIRIIQNAVEWKDMQKDETNFLDYKKDIAEEINKTKALIRNASRKKNFLTKDMKNYLLNSAEIVRANLLIEFIHTKTNFDKLRLELSQILKNLMVKFPHAEPTFIRNRKEIVIIRKKISTSDYIAGIERNALEQRLESFINSYNI